MRYICVALTFTLVFLESQGAGKRALLIGISQYPSHTSPSMIWTSIHGANDVTLIKGQLMAQGFVTKYLTDRKATAKGIRDALIKLEKECQPGDLVYIHFSGHGQAYEDLSGDEADGWDEALVPYDAFMHYRKGIYEGGNHILDDELEGYLSAIRRKVGASGYVYVVLDACHMGGASRGEEAEEEEVYIRGTDTGFTPNNKKYIPKIDRRGNMKLASHCGMSGICIIEACRAYQTNAEIKEEGHYYGPLTYYISETLKSHILSANTGWIETVRMMMARDRRLIKQNMVIEKTD